MLWTSSSTTQNSTSAKRSAAKICRCREQSRGRKSDRRQGPYTEAPACPGDQALGSVCWGRTPSRCEAIRCPQTPVRETYCATPDLSEPMRRCGDVCPHGGAPLRALRRRRLRRCRHTLALHSVPLRQSLVPARGWEEPQHGFPRSRPCWGEYGPCGPCSHAAHRSVGGCMVRLVGPSPGPHRHTRSCQHPPCGLAAALELRSWPCRCRRRHPVADWLERRLPEGLPR